MNPWKFHPLTAVTKCWEGVTVWECHPLMPVAKCWEGVTVWECHPLMPVAKCWEGVTVWECYPLMPVAKCWEGVTVWECHPLTAVTKYWEGFTLLKIWPKAGQENSPGGMPLWKMLTVCPRPPLGATSQSAKAQPPIQCCFVQRSRWCALSGWRATVSRARID
jgi:hypothetical protein